MSGRAAGDGAIGSALRDALGILLPVECSGCGAPGRSLCRGCLIELRPEVHAVQRDGVVVHAGLEYAGVARRVIGAFKDGGRPGLARALGPALRSAVLASLAAAPGDPSVPVEIVTVPSSWAAWRARGYRPVHALLRAAGLRSSRLLRRTRRRADQVGLGRVQRRENVAGSIAVRRRAGSPTELGGRRFLLVDDILTTGATIQEAIRAVTAAGGTIAGVSVLAETPRNGRRG